MNQPTYDQIDSFYLNFVQRGLQAPNSLFSRLTAFLLEMVGDVQGKQVLDLCCGEGHLSFELANRGATVVGVDLSKVNLAAATQQFGERGNPRFIIDDAQSLSSIGDGQFDIVACKMSLMDLPDIEMTFQAVQRVLKPNGRFYTALLHPCFQTPFTMPFQPIEQDEAGGFKHQRVQRYFEEGLWHSGGTGVRGHVGAYHRTLSTYLNSLQGAGLQLVRLEEPPLAVSEPGSLDHQWHQQIAKMLYIEAKSVVCGL